MAGSYTYFIVHVDFEVPRGPYQHQKILAGTLLKCRQDHVQEYVLHAESLDSDMLHFTFTRNKYIEQIRSEYVDYLLAITTLGKRLTSFSEHKLKRAVEVKVGDAVRVVVKLPTYELFFADAVLRYKGNPDATKGILFGVELLSHKGMGTTDGTFCKKQYFNCEDNCGMFVPFDKLMFHVSSANHEPMKAIYEQFKIGMRVIIIDELIDGKEQQIGGVLKCLLPSQTTGGSLAGVELDDYMEGWNYSGYVGDKKYFEPQPKLALLPLDCVIPLNLIEGEKSNKPKLFDQVKSYFISDSKKEGSQNTSSFGWEMVSGRGRGKNKAHAPDVQSITTIDDELLGKISKIVKENWYVMGQKLGVSSKKLEAISKKSSYFDVKAFQMLCTWQSDKPDVTDKLGVIARICMEIGNKALCYELLQGVDDDILEFVAQEAYNKWNNLAEKLNLSADIIDQISKKQKTDYKAVCIEVLFIWRTNQPAVSDKVSFLASALDQLGFQHVATFLIQGLDDEFLQQLSVGLSLTWQGVAIELGMTKKEVDDIEYGSNKDKSKQAYEAFMKWKKQQPSDVDKLGVLAKALKNRGHDDLAKHLLGGLEDGAIHKLVLQLRKINVDKETLCTALNFKESHLRYFQQKFVKDFARMKAMLLAWRAQLDRTKDKKQELVKLLGSYGFTDILKNVFSENDEPEKMDIDYADTDYGDANQVSDKMITYVSEGLLELDVTSLKTYLRISSSSTHDPKDFKLEAYHLLITSREQHKNNFKFVLAEALDNIRRKDLADVLLNGNPEYKGSETKPTRVSRSDDAAESRPPSEPKHVNRPPTELKHVNRPPAEPKHVNRPPAEPKHVNRPPSEPKHNFSVGSMVEVHVAGIPMYGVIKWIGDVPQMKDQIAGIELDEYCSAATDGTFGDKRYFQTAPRRALFMPVSKCKPDARFSSPTENFGVVQQSEYYEFDSPRVTEITIPPMKSKPHRYGAMGIQGDLNSCYLDSTIFSMFAFVDVFDDLLHRPSDENDLKEYTKVQKVLKEDIVYPLRKYGIVKADNIKKLRELLDALGTTAGMRDQEKDPEEFLTTLLQEVLKSDPLFKIRVHGTKPAQEMNFYQMFMERDDTLTQTPNVQTLLEQSFLNTDIKFVEIPSCFIVQMPRFGKGYKLYNRILPTLNLDITHMLEDFPRPCVVCGRLSFSECRDCSSAKLGGEQITAYCNSCYERVHKKPQNQTHGKPRDLSIPENFPTDLTEEEERKELHTEMMELFAVVCIETSHYVAFVKAGEKADSQWLFFDSMADRIGDQDGYNIPKITPLPHFQSWIEDPKAYEHLSDRELEEPLRRLLCDAYMCFYRSTTVCF